MSTKTSDIDHVFTKLDMKVENRDHVFAWFYHEGRRILYTKRSHGRGEVKHFDLQKIRQQLSVNQHQFKGLIDCSVDRQAYIAILQAKGRLE